MTRRRNVIVAFAVVMSVLVATAMPVGASHGLVVASINTTDSDFNAGSLTNMTVSGSGDSADVELRSQATIEDFERSSPLNDYGGDTGWYDIVNSPTKSGSNALHAPGDTGGPQIISSTGGLSEYPDQGENFTAHLRVEDFNNWQSAFIFATQNETATPGGYAIELNYGNNAWSIVRDIGGSDIQLASGTFSSSLDTWYEVEVQWENDGTITATLKDGDGSVIETISASDSTYSNGGIGWYANEQGGAGTANYYFDFVTGAGTSTPGTYISANHTVENSEQGFVNITENTNATATVTWEGWDGSSWTQLTQSTGITSTGNQTFSWSTSSTTKVRVNVTVFNDSNNGEPAFTFADEGVEFTANETFVNNSSATPTGDLSTSTPTLEIDINDTDFPLSQSDSVDVEFFVDGSSIGTDSLSSNGTASATVSSALSGGDHTWHVVANDSYGHSVTSQTFDISTPGNITFRREEPGHPIIDDREINVTIYGESDGNQFVQNFSTSNGNVSLSDVPSGERLVVVASTDGYHQREVVITDIFEQTDMYLLNTSETSVTVTFDIQDSTGLFSETDTEFIIERSVNRSLFDSGGFTQEAIAGDRLGAVTEYEVELKQGQRYTITIRNPGGDSRVLGAQVAKSTGTIPIRINSIDLSVNETQGFNWSASTIQSGGNDFVEFVYNDEQDQTTSVDLVIYEYDNASNEIHNQTHTGTFGELKVTEQLTGDQINKTWAVQFDATRGGSTESGTVVVGRDTQPLGVPLDDAWKHRIALLSLIVVGFIVGGGVSPEAGGIAIVSAAGMWLYIGWMPAEVTAVAIGFGSLTAVGFAVGKRGGEPVQ